MQTFTLKPTAEYIELMKLLQIQNIAQSGGHAKILIENGLVTVNDETELRKRKKLRPGDKITIGETTIYINN